MMVVVVRRSGGNTQVNLMRFLTFMSFMMSWKSPPKALHSFSIPASIFPQARKNPPQTFYLPKKKKKKKKNASSQVLKYSSRIINGGSLKKYICLVEVGEEFQTPRGQSPPLKKKTETSSSGKEGKTHTGVKNPGRDCE